MLDGGIVCYSGGMEKTVTLVNDKVEIAFPYDMQIIEVVRGIAGRDYDPTRRVWTTPATPYHYSRVLEVLSPLGFSIHPDIARLADQKAPPPKAKYPAGLYPFQRIGVDFLYQSGGRAILADDMGLGKTITSLAYVRMFGYRTLIVCPASVVFKWKQEWEKWMDGRSVQVVTTGKQAIEEEADAVIMSYAIMTSKFKELSQIHFDVAIFDEAHALKTWKAQRTKAARSLVRGGIPKVLFLSGTPFMNHPTELFSLLNMLDGAGFDNFFKFARRYCGAQYLEGQWFIPKDVVTNRDELAARLKRVMVRRTKKDVALDLPDLTRTAVHVELTNKVAYRDAVKDVRAWLKSKDKNVKNPAHILTRLNVLRQIVGDGKVAAAVELAENALQSGQVVLFAHHKDVVAALTTELRPYGVSIISGDTPQGERQARVDDFLKGGKQVMIITTAGAEGIDLYSASTIIFVEREWTPAREEQAEARLHRMGQKNPVNAYYLVAKGTIDDRLNSIIEAKRKLVGQVIRQDEILTQIMEEL